MLWKFWQNPEFIRHCRSELRRSRMTTVALVVFFVCALTILACWASAKAQITYYHSEALVLVQPAVAPAALAQNSHELSEDDAEQTARTPSSHSKPTIAAITALKSYSPLMFMQFGVLTFWSLLSCTQGISRERERNTWDFQRTTRLTPSELLVGKLLGEPVLAYFIFLCVLPVTLVTGIVGHVPLLKILLADFVTAIAALFIGIAGLWVSSLFENKSRGIGLIAGLAIYGMFLGCTGMADSPFSGLAGFSPLTTFLPLLGRVPFALRPMLFGGRVPWLLMTVLLYVTFGAWLVLMLVRNLKKDINEMRLLSHWQAVGCCAFLNFVLYAVLDPTRGNPFGAASDFVSFMVLINGIIFFFLGVAMLSTSERIDPDSLLSARSFFSGNGLQWPWLMISAVVSYLLLIWGLYMWKGQIGFDGNLVAWGAVSMLIVLVFITRDVLFIQWCKLTRLRSPIVKGVLFLGLYYASVAVLFTVLDITSHPAATGLANALTPSGAFTYSSALVPVSVVVGIVIQVMATAFLVSAIRGRVQQTELVPAHASGD
ncbi:MAG: ABC transporter permease subunit [Terriglobales bacterium]